MRASRAQCAHDAVDGFSCRASGYGPAAARQRGLGSGRRGQEAACRRRRRRGRRRQRGAAACARRVPAAAQAAQSRCWWRGLALLCARKVLASKSVRVNNWLELDTFIFFRLLKKIVTLSCRSPALLWSEFGASVLHFCSRAEHDRVDSKDRCTQSMAPERLLGEGFSPTVSTERMIWTVAGKRREHMCNWASTTLCK